MQLLPPAQVERLHNLIRSLNRELLVGGAALMVVLLTAYLVGEAIRRRRTRRRKSVRPEVELSIDVAGLEAIPLPPDAPTLEFYSLPVRLAVIVLAPAGRWGRLPPLERIHGVLDAIVPGLADVAVAHRSMLYYWPPQVSARGFAHLFFRQAPLPGGGRGTPWCAAAGGFKIGEQPAVAGLVLSAEKPTSFGQRIIETETKWLDVLRVKARD